MCSKCRNECHACGSSLKWIIMMKHPEESSRWKAWYSLKWSPPPPAPSLPAARHNPRSGTDRLTNKVNKYFPPLLKANQILILEVWSAEKKQQTIGRGELIELILSLVMLGAGWKKKKEKKKKENWGGEGGAALTVGVHFRPRMDKYLDISV